MNPDVTDKELIRKYDVRGPRYTSYPTAASFQEFDENHSWNPERYIAERNREPHPVSLYFHIPFCFSLCWYCACTKVITKDTGKGDLYLDYLEREMDLVSRLLHKRSGVIQIHFGGGTPTFLDPSQLKRLGNAIHTRFNTSSDTEFGVEIDPRACTGAHVEALKAIGCNRASLGVQDTNPEVQEAVRRVQPFEQTVRVAGKLREAGIDSINIDLIYGLPRQTVALFRKTMDDVLALRPDRLAIYSYAHMPGFFPAQKLLNVDEMPSTEQKLDMLSSTIKFFTANGYRYIGMDHFSRENDELSLALDNGTLQRNFQGYSTHSGADLYAFGMSGISNTGSRYWQNAKDLGSYYRRLDRNELPAYRGVKLDRDDLLRKEVINKLMCLKTLNLKEIERHWDIDANEYFRDELARLEALEKDGLVVLEDREIEITGTGRLFLRNIAMIFDRYHQNGLPRNTFSKTV